MDTSASFTNPQLLTDSTSFLKTFRLLNVGEENDRPTKRLKTLPDSSSNVNRSTYEQLTILLNGSAQDSPVTNLANLHNLVE
jgi:serine/threonine-protein kinase ATR